MKNDIKKYLKIGIVASVLYLIVTHLENIYGFVEVLFAAAFPLVLGVVIAYILSLIMKPIEKIYFPNTKNKILIKTRRPLSILASFLIIAAIIAMVWVIVVPEIAASCALIGREIPSAYKAFQTWIFKITDEIPQIQQGLSQLQNFDISGAISKLINIVVSGTGGIINSAVSVVSRVVGMVTTLVIGLIFAIYLLYNKEKLLKQISNFSKAYIKMGHKEWCKHALKVANDSFSNFIVGQCTEAVILGLLCIIGMVIFRFPYAVMTGVVVGVTALVPIVGAFLGAAVGAFMIFTVDPTKAMLFLIFLIILMQIEGNLIYPRVVGNSISLPGIWVLAAVTVGGGLFGILGMLIGVPLTATIYKLTRESVHKRLATEAVAETGDENGNGK